MRFTLDYRFNSDAAGYLKKDAKMILFLDVDGVLADWVGGVFDATGVEPGVWDTVGHGLLPTEHQAEVDAVMATRSFWAHLRRYPWAEELVMTARELASSVVFCTQPFDSAECLAGKYDWLSRHFGATMDNIVFTRNKWRLANPTSLLVDDNVDNCNKFHLRGGHSIVFPQPWNTIGKDFSDVEVRYSALDELYESMHNVSRITNWYK